MENLNIGITLMVIGMAAVFVFLGFMIVAMNFTAKIVSIINKYFPEPIPEEKNTRKKKQDDESEIALAIAVAMRERAKVI
ncbi:OadG family protein [bacterium]|nr:OadG family protein [bacterium]MBP3847327.1 OadG family protein [bacterium]